MSATPNGAGTVRVRGLWKSFHGHEVLRGIDLDVDQGEVVVIFGRSGSGKSTLLRCLNFLEEPTEGSIEIAGIRIEGGGHRTRAKREQIRQLRIRTGMVFQDFNLFPHRTALDERHRRPRDRAREIRRDAKRQARELLEWWGFGDKADRLPDPALRRAAAARRDRPCTGHEPEGDALRRADLCARSGADRRGARR